MSIQEHFLASYYRQIIDAQIARGQLNRLTIALAFVGLPIMALGTWLDLEWLRCLGALPLIIAIVTGCNSLIHSLQIRRLRRELDSADRACAPRAQPRDEWQCLPATTELIRSECSMKCP